MTTITELDIRTELEEAPAEFPELFDLNRFYFGPVKKVYAVYGTRLHTFYESENVLLGIYENEQDAERVANRLTENSRAAYKYVCNLPREEYESLIRRCDSDETVRKLFNWWYDEWEYTVKPLVVNAPSVDEDNIPDAQMHWY